MAAPVSAPAAAPAAAPIEAPRTFPVAAAPMIAPVAAPHAAPWPTGVSQEFNVRQIKAMADATVRIFVPIMRYSTPLNRAAREMLCGSDLRTAFVCPTDARDIQKLCLLLRQGPARRVQLSSSCTFHAGDTGSQLLPMDQ